ncbi:PREDICTED: uncharacterized protein LOC105515093 [Colobus angolensis palliatus]|uniref:uncharacterized protein LOC105515093 n=1 Tax=Colobus angolensis palliatus TaxID=336983 RepID=UPI0005F470EC|nr:PREDICTED: uncharacterized protein LOC105515093 [Colobus angolensis palliatus]
MTCILTGVDTETKPRPSSWASVDLETWVGLSPSPCSVAWDARCLPSFTVPRLTCLESTCCCFVYSPSFAPLPAANLSPLTFFPTRNTCQWNISGVCVEFLEDLQVDRKSQCVLCGLPSRWLCPSLSFPPLSRNTHTKGLTFYPKHFLRYFPHTMIFPFLRGIGMIKGVNVPLSPVTVGLRPCEHLGQSHPRSLGRCKILQRRGRLVLQCCVLRWSFSGGLGVPPKAQ